MKATGKKNTKGVEIGEQAYYGFTLALLRRCGSLTGAQLESEIKAAFGHLWGPEDLRKLPSGRLKWQNMVDWAKSQGHKQKTFFNRTKQMNGQRVCFLVMPEVCQEPALVEWVMAKKPKTSMKKKCLSCGKWSSLAAPVCSRLTGGCGAALPKPTRKVVPTLN
jgi:hypothetical protein